MLHVQVFSDYWGVVLHCWIFQVDELFVIVDMLLIQANNSQSFLQLVIDIKLSLGLHHLFLLLDILDQNFLFFFTIFDELNQIWDEDLWIDSLIFWIIKVGAFWYNFSDLLFCLALHFLNFYSDEPQLFRSYWFWAKGAFSFGFAKLKISLVVIYTCEPQLHYLLLNVIAVEGHFLRLFQLFSLEGKLILQDT